MFILWRRRERTKRHPLSPNLPGGALEGGGEAEEREQAQTEMQGISRASRRSV